MKTSITMPEFIAHAAKHIGLENINCIVEVGALNAHDSVYFKKCIPHAKVYAIEGLEDNFNKYMKDLQGVYPILAIISNKDGVVKYHVKEINGIHGIFDRGQEYGSKYVLEKCYKLSSIATIHNIEAIDMMKVDVEGATLEILEGMDTLLDTVKIMHIESESIPYFSGQRLHPEVCTFLTSKGFQMVELTSVDITSDGKQYDSVWIKK